MTREPQPAVVERGAEGDLRVVLVTFDRTSRDASLIRSDGKEARLPIDSTTFGPTSNLRRVHFVPATRAMLFETVEGHDIVARPATPDTPAPIGGRPVVYLDHNHWNTLYKARHQEHRVPDPYERDAAHWLIDQVGRGEVILPKSAQHVQETCQWPNAEERYLLALTILQLSGGWHLRDPLHVRLEELRCSMTSHYRRWPTKPPAAITLEAVLHSARREPYLPSKDFPADAAYLVSQLVSVTADVDTMLDAEVQPAEPQHGWVERNQLLTDWVRDNLSAKEHRRRSTEVAFVTDTQAEIARVAAELQPTERQFKEWLSVHLPVDVGAMPCLGLFRELLHDKTVAGVRWEPNDLTDMMYLTAAAGYCDHVVAEREVCGQLSQGVRRLDRTVRVHPKLGHLKREVEDRGWSTGVSA